ncbi:MAG: hypothetical protein GYA20_00050 [Chloroflexi bacterium]|nr:hypothetical protein [Chloroflexota bacterium]
MKFTRKLLSVVLSFAVLAGLGAAIFLPAGSVAAASDARRGTPGGWGGSSSAGNGSATGAALTPLSDAEAEALQYAILEEYGAFNLYTAVNAQFGSTIPFSYIVRSEQQHINALVRQAQKYGVEVPENPGLTNPPVFASLTEACQAGVDAEIADAALYDELKLVTTHADLLQVYDRLQKASLESHLPAFQLCD